MWFKNEEFSCNSVITYILSSPVTLTHSRPFCLSQRFCHRSLLHQLCFHWLCCWFLCVTITVIQKHRVRHYYFNDVIIDYPVRNHLGNNSVHCTAINIKNCWCFTTFCSTPVHQSFSCIDFDLIKSKEYLMEGGTLHTNNNTDSQWT